MITLMLRVGFASLSPPFDCLLPPRGPLERGDDAGIAGAAAQMPAKHIADLGLGSVRSAGQIIGERHQNARRAEAALQSVVVAKRLLQRIELAVGRGKRLHGPDL